MVNKWRRNDPVFIRPMFVNTPLGLQRNWQWITGRVIDPNWRLGVMTIATPVGMLFRRHDSESVRSVK